MYYKESEKEYYKWCELRRESPAVLQGFVVSEALALVLRFLLRIMMILEKK